MKPTQSLAQVAFALLSMSSVTSGFSLNLPGLDNFIVRRADSKSTTETATETAAATKTTGGGADNTYNLNTGAQVTSTPATQTTVYKTTVTGKNGKSTVSTVTSAVINTNTQNKTAAATHTTFNAIDPAGGVVMVTPATTANMQLYKIGDYVTWVWNYTSLQATPTAVDVLASCSFATRTFTLTQNMTFETLGSYTWDTGAYQSSNVASPLLTEEYTLIIYDADSSVSATAEAGYLDTYDGFTFGMYAPQSYTPLSDGWTCATCSGALSDTERRAIGFVLTMSIITVLSFTWFVTGMQVTL